MQNPRTFVAALALTLLLSLSTTAVGGTGCEPGQIMTPCSSAIQAPNTGDISTPPAAAPGQTDTPPNGDVSLTEIASSVLLSIVSFF